MDMGDTKNSNNKPTWNESYEINIPIIDNQHKTFFEIYDDLLSYSTNNEANDQTSIIIKRLTDYLTHHFSTEEALMKAANYKGIDAHIIQHRFFEKKINELKLAHIYKNPQLLSQLLLFIRKWFLSHISQVDFKYKDSVLEHLKKNNKIESLGSR